MIFSSNSQTFLDMTKNGTTGSFSLVKCNCRSKEHKLMNPAIEKTLIEADVSLRILILRCVRWYKTVKV